MPLPLRSVSLRQLQVFLEVYQRGSITAAARHLHLTQPTVSLQLKRLSEQLSEPLYRVHHRQLAFTESARLLARCALEILQSAERLEMNLADLHQLKAGTLRIALVSSAKYFIPNIIGPFVRQYPLVDLQLKIVNRAELLARLAQHQDDVYVISQLPEQPPLNVHPLVANPLHLIAPDPHPLSGHPRLSLKDLAQEAFIFREAGSGTRLAIDQCLAALDLALEPRMVIESNEAIKQCVAAGLGLAILSEHAITYGGMAGIQRLKVKELPIQTHWQFVWPKDRPPSVLAEAFLGYLTAHR
ncbi:LysR family transcriptional regulator [Ferrimonas balearica]|uniref:LysR family transcriptional regulator n=1 Tax=Ferrimonas balearica TaxID=44012 RepID=UPI001C98E57E|nr:LysR family transcriptional regulator [Ferrimonas balearica]MBY5992906.1 LysR family transcriptional regulator [Ferrimonas balearica]